MDLIEVTGERREMVDKLLEQASLLLGEGGRCFFQDCFGPAHAHVELAVSGDKAAIKDEVVICEKHHQILEWMMETLPDDVTVAGFLMFQLDPARTPLGKHP